MKTGKLATGILLGAAAGAILGILLAPEKGSETRKKISKSSSDFKESVKTKFNNIIDELSSKYEDALNGAEELAEEGKDKTDTAKAELKNALS